MADYLRTNDDSLAPPLPLKERVQTQGCTPGVYLDRGPATFQLSTVQRKLANGIVDRTVPYIGSGTSLYLKSSQRGGKEKRVHDEHENPSYRAKPRNANTLHYKSGYQVDEPHSYQIIVSCREEQLDSASPASLIDPTMRRRRGQALVRILEEISMVVVGTRRHDQMLRE